MKHLGFSELTKRLYILPASAKAKKIDITDDVEEYLRHIKKDINSILEQERLSYNKGYKDGKSEILGFIDWLGKEDLKRYPEGWSQPGGSNGFHLSDKELLELFLKTN